MNLFEPPSSHFEPGKQACLAQMVFDFFCRPTNVRVWFLDMNVLSAGSPPLEVAQTREGSAKKRGGTSGEDRGLSRNPLSATTRENANFVPLRYISRKARSAAKRATLRFSSSAASSGDSCAGNPQFQALNHAYNNIRVRFKFQLAGALSNLRCQAGVLRWIRYIS